MKPTHVQQFPPLKTKSSFLLAIVFFALCIQGCNGNKEEPQAPTAVQVTVSKVSKGDIPVSMEFVGQTKGAIDAEIRARVEGVITAVHFEEGKEVKEGQPLYSIDPAPFNAKVAQAQGALAEAETKLTKAVSDLQRIRPLAKIKAVSERDLDAAVAQEGSARGAVDAAKAVLDSAKIELSYCEISSPVSGIIGLTKAKVGEFVGRAPNPVVLNTVSQLDPIHVRFSVTEKEYLYFARLKQEEAKAGKSDTKRPLDLILADGKPIPDKGEVASIEREIDATTGTLSIEAKFPNPQKLIRPGQFAKVRTVAETISGALMVPKKSIRELQGQYQIFVVKPDNTVDARTVTLGSEVGQKQVVETGLTDGDTIVVEGAQKLKVGMLVAPQPESSNG